MASEAPNAPHISGATPSTLSPSSPHQETITTAATDSEGFQAQTTLQKRSIGPSACAASTVSPLAPGLKQIATDAVGSPNISTTGTVAQRLSLSPIPLASTVPEVLMQSSVESTEVLQKRCTSAVGKHLKRKHKKQGKDSGSKKICVVGADSLVTMVESYTAHFAQYCAGRKKVVQKLPARVWKQVYQDYIEDKKEQARAEGMVFDPKKLPQERTLQDALRSALQDIGTGVADCNIKGIDEATPQDVDLLAKLKQTDTFHKRKMSAFRESLATGVVTAVAGGSGTPGATNSRTPEAVSSSVSVASTKKELLRSAVESMDKMTAVVEKGSKNLTQAVICHNAVYEKEMQGKEVLRKCQLQSLKAADAQRSLEMLVVLKNEGVISEDEFKKRAKVVAHLQ